MASVWKCPACGTPIRYEDYEQVRRGAPPFFCHFCRLPLAVDKVADTLIPAVPKSPTPKRAKADD